MALGVVLVLFALSFLGRFLVASDPFVQHRDAAYWPPQRVRVIDAEGRWTRPFVYGFERALHPETFQWEYAVDESNVTELALFARGPVYRVLWLFDWDVHLVGTVDGAPVFFLGTDRFGRDLLARLLWGGMVSLSVPVLAGGDHGLAGHSDRGGVGLLRRLGGQPHSACHRGAGLVPAPAAVDGAGGGDSARSSRAWHCMPAWR